MMTLVEHVQELRRRLILGVISVIVCSIPFFLFRDGVLRIILKPAGLSSLDFLHPVEAFASYVRLSMACGLLVCAPFLLTQVWLFMAPALKKREIRASGFAFLFGGVMFYAGCAFGHLVVLDAALGFLLGIAGTSLEPHLTIGNYSSFVLSLTFVFGLAFELPLVILLLVCLGIFDSRMLRAYRRHLIVGTWILAALLTPPDVVTQALLAVPLMLLYEVSILLARWMENRRAAQHASEDVS